MICTSPPRAAVLSGTAALLACTLHRLRTVLPPTLLLHPLTAEGQAAAQSHSSKPRLVHTLPITLNRTTNREWIFKARPTGAFVPEDCFELIPCPIPTCAPGQILVAPYLCSVDPTLFNALRGSGAASRTDGSHYYGVMNWTVGKVPSWMMIAQVLESTVEQFRPGQLVNGSAPWREVSAVDAAGFVHVTAPPEAVMSCMGHTGRTGYLGVKCILRPNKGDIAYVSGAAGATGLAACQTFVNLGCQVVGSAGSDEKVAFLQSIGVQAFNYKKEAVLQGISRLAPQGIHCAFDNVGGTLHRLTESDRGLHRGLIEADTVSPLMLIACTPGETLEAILEMLNDGGKVALCGAISQYNSKLSEKYGVTNTFHLVAKRIRMEGFILPQFSEPEVLECRQTLEKWVDAGKLTAQYTVVDGFDRLISGGLGGLVIGSNTGKLLVKVEL